MDYYMLERARYNLDEDHRYCSSGNTDELAATDTCIISDLSQQKMVRESENVWIDVDGLETPIGILSAQLDSDLSNFIIEPTPRTSNFIEPTESHLSQRWIPCEKSTRLKVLKILERCVLRGNIYMNQRVSFSGPSRYVYHKTYEQLVVRYAARKIRAIFATLSWRLELCYSLHHWCLALLPDSLLSMYCVAVTELWRQNKVSALLAALNRMIKDRDSSFLASCSPSVRAVLELSENTFIQPSAAEAVAPFGLFNKHTLCTPSDVRSTILPTNSVNLGGSFSYPSRSHDEVHLACMTFPAARNSSRLRTILRMLSALGRVSLESSEEQKCDMMRVRITLFIRRLTALLDEPNRGPIYLVGFGVGGLMMLLSVVHMYLTSNSDNIIHRQRWGPDGLAGLICIGLPLRGLKGPRGYTVGTDKSLDPLLSLPEIPTLLVVGSASRLGDPQDVYRFRRILLSSQATRRHQCQSAQTVTSETGCRGVQVVTVGAGADHLLRLRPTACFRWGLTQEMVDRRIIGAIRRFICTVERSFSSSGAVHRPQPHPLPVVDAVEQRHMRTDSSCSSSYSTSPALLVTDSSASHWPTATSSVTEQHKNYPPDRSPTTMPVCSSLSSSMTSSPRVVSGDSPTSLVSVD